MYHISILQGIYLTVHSLVVIFNEINEGIINITILKNDILPELEHDSGYKVK